MKRFISLLFVSLYVLAFTTQAQARLTGELSVFPKNPNPFDEVTISLESYGFDVDGARITWTVGGSMVATGVGEKTIKLRMGGAGTQTTLTVLAIASSGEELRLGTTLSPQSVSLVWESPESYVPPFYEGKALAGEGSTVHVFAIPEIIEKGKRLLPSEVSYSWYVNEKFLSSASGRGKNVLVTKLDYLSSEHDIRVVARSPSGFQAEQKLTLETREPLPTFYISDELLGTNLTQALRRRFETTNEVSLAVVPYYMSLRGDLSSTGSYSWAINGSPIATGKDNVLLLRPQTGTSGARTISVSLEQTKRRLQNMQASLEVVFDTRR